MPGRNGIELGYALRDMGFKGKILYLTASEDYAIEAFKVKAYNYILKPVKAEPFFLALDDAFDISSTQEPSDIVVKSTQGNIRIHPDNILYACLDKRAISYFLADGESVRSRSIRIPFAEAARNLLVEPSFALCGASIAINLQHIHVIEDNSVTFNNNEKLFIPKRAVKKILSDWKAFLDK